MRGISSVLFGDGLRSVLFAGCLPLGRSGLRLRQQHAPCYRSTTTAAQQVI